MKLIIAGSRTIRDPLAVERAVATALAIWERPGDAVELVVSGGAAGVDELGERWAAARGIPIRRFEARWEVHGRAAGPIRNREMAAFADALVAVWDGESPGTADMIEAMRARDRRVFVSVVAT